MNSLGTGSSTGFAPGALTALDRGACLALLAGRPVGRLVFTHRALPDVIPVNYQLDGENLVIRLSSGSVAASATTDAVVAFEADEIDFAARTGWSVTVVGRAHEITDADELRRVQGLGLTSWVADVRDHYVSVAAEKVTGRRLFPAPDPAAQGPAGNPIDT
jgi:nitroimidazol reductase NimA-like FMN-containing flavoprotein (pyridoxamine 5'-phosphate oxidase superfamily)